jgi:serine/threonine protein kinase
MYDTCYRTPAQQPNGKRSKEASSNQKERPQHLILMEYCEGGHALDVCNKLTAAGQRFDLSTLIIAFGQICNAVSYLHAQRPPIVHRDLKPVNFLVKNGAYKLCDFGSAVFGHVDLRTAKARSDAEEVIEKTTTQMFRAPEMIDLYSVKRLTQA